MIFSKDNLFLTEHLILEVKKSFSKINILPIFAKQTYKSVDAIFNLGIDRVCFEFKPDQVISELKEFVQTKKDLLNSEEKQYMINFYEIKGMFVVDISGTLKKDNLVALRMMFSNFLQGKLHKLRGIVYLFNNMDDLSLDFQTGWALFRFWKDLNIDYNKIFYLSQSIPITKYLSKYLEPFGVTHAENLFEVVKAVYPEAKGKSDAQLFGFVSSIIQNQI